MVRRWIDLAFAESFVLWPFINRELFNVDVRRILEGGVSGSESPCDNDQVGLLHSVIALRQRNNPDLMSLDGKRSHSTEARG